MQWEDISVQRFQEIYKLSQEESLDEFEISYSVVKILYDLTDKMIEAMPMKKFNRYRSKISFVFASPEIPGEAPKKLRKGFKSFKLDYDIKKLSFGQYIDLNAFSEEPVLNAHLILGTVLRSNGDAAGELKKISDLIVQMPITKVFHAVNLTLRKFQIFNKSYSGLFDISEEGSEDYGNGFKDEFNKRYGWIYSATQVADHYKITLEEAFNLNIVPALNALSYLKARARFEKEEVKSWRKQ